MSPNQKLLEEQARKKVFAYITAKARTRWEYNHLLMKKRLRLGVVLVGAAFVIKYGLKGWYFLEYEIDPYQPKMSNYIAKRLG